MTRNSTTNSAHRGVTRRSFAAGAGAAGLLAGTAPFNIVRAQSGPLKVGVLLPRSGAQAGIGQDCQRGVELAPPIFKELGLPELAIMALAARVLVLHHGAAIAEGSPAAVVREPAVVQSYLGAEAVD